LDLLHDFRKATEDEKIEMLKIFLGITSELKFESFTEKNENEIQTRSAGKIKNKDLDTLRLQALGIFLEAFDPSKQRLCNYAFLGLVQLGPLAENSLMDLVKTDSDEKRRSLAISVLGHSDNSRVAHFLLDCLEQPAFQSITLQTMGHLKISREDKKNCVKKIETLLQQPGNSRENEILILTTLVLLGEIERFPEILTYCPEDPREDLYVYLPEVKDCAWIQIRRIARNLFDKRYSLMKSEFKDSSSQLSINLNKNFQNYLRRHDLNLKKKNWLKWWKNQLMTFS
jgi:hypothetical protein